MSNDPRDTQFQGFAEKLADELMQVPGTRLGRTVVDVRMDVCNIITQKSYDLVRHACENISNKQERSGVLLLSNAMIRAVPDMPELPKEQE